jgi:DNA primase
VEDRRNGRGKWAVPSEAFTEEQVEAILNACGVEVVSEAGNEFLCMCPFHGNRHTPSFSISKTEGVYLCFNSACGATGGIKTLIKYTTGYNDFEALRLISKTRTNTHVSLVERRKRSVEKKEMPVFPQETLERMKQEFWKSEKALAYMHGRGFDDVTLDHFNIGYSPNKDLVATPMYDSNGAPVGVIGRTISGEKRFQNSKNLPTSQTLWNINNAKRAGDTVIIVEANFDGMRIHQAGFPGVVACLGGNFSPEHADQLARHFSTIIIMTDNDPLADHVYKNCRRCSAAGKPVCQGHNPGRQLGTKIAEEMSSRAKVVRWAAQGDGIVYPHDAKDAGDMTLDEIRHCVNESVSNFVYRSWRIPS